MKTKTTREIDDGMTSTVFQEIDEPLAPRTSGSLSDLGEGPSSSVHSDESYECADTRVSMENFALIRVLGKGAYGKVFLVRKIGGHDGGRVYAMKVLKKARVTYKPKTVEHTIAERKILERLKGKPFLVNMVYAFQSETKLHIVMEFAGGGELFTHLFRKKRLDVSTSRLIIAETVVALDNVHRCNVIYRDLKLENILLDADGHVVLADFGLSKLFNHDDLPSANSYCGTIEYMSPEVVKRVDGYTETVDWWSLGVVGFELLTGCSPFTVDGLQNSSQDIARRIVSKAVPYPEHVDEVSRDFLDRLLNKDPRRRLGASGVDEIKRHAFFDGLDWTLLEQKRLPPPLKPMLVNNGYSFVPPSVIFSNDNVIGDEFLNDNVKALMQNSPFFAKYEMDTSAEGFLGRGTFSVCRKCTRRSNGQQFAVKIVSQRFAYHAMREIRILEMLNPHENIVAMLDAMSDSLHYYIVLELLNGGELLQTLRNMVKFTEFQAARIMAQLVHAVSHIHAKGVVHRDLKPENIIFVDAGVDDIRIRLIDFGFARILPKESGSGGDALVTPCCGTLFYAAPEVLEVQDELPQYNQQCDLWSLGVILFTMLSGKIPFRARSNTETAADVIKRIREAEFSFDDSVWTSVDDQAKDLITGLLTVDPKKRLSLRQLALHPWLTNSGLNSSHELQTPNALPSLADETFNETMDAFITANRDGFHLMDVDTAPLLVKRRGLKRRLEKDAGGSSGGHKSSSLQPVPENAELHNPNNSSGTSTPSIVSPVLPVADSTSRQSNNILLNGSELSDNQYAPTTSLLDVEMTDTNRIDTPTTASTPKLAAFTEYRDMRPSYLKYSRDDYTRGRTPEKKRSSDSD